MLKLYFNAFKTHLMSQFQYRFSFIMTIIGQFIVSFTTFVGLTFIFLRFEVVEGFTYWQILLCYSSVLMSFALGECFGKGFDKFSDMIRDGSFDRILVRPRNPIYQVFIANMDFSRIGRLIQAIIVLCYALPRSGVIWTWDKVITIFLMIVCNSVLFITLYLLEASFSFFTIASLGVINIFTDGGYEFGKYPFGIYGKPVLRFLTFVIPLALVQYYPLLYLIGRTSNIIYMLSPLFSLWFIIPCYFVWTYGLHKYKSTGS